VKVRTEVVEVVLEGVGTALLLFFPYLQPFLLDSSLSLYHHSLPITNLLGGALIDMLGLSLLAIGFLVAIQYLPRSPQRILNTLFTGLMLWRIVGIAIQMQTNLKLFAYWSGLREQLFIAIFLLSGVLAFFFPRIAEPITREIRVVIAAFAFCAFWIVPQLLHLMLTRQPDESAASIHLPPPTHSTSSRRILWILYDELSYDQAFDHPASGMQLPNFDRLRSESISFSDVIPAGFYTDRIIPSLFLGRRMDWIRSTVDGELWYNDESQHHWLAYDPNTTLFGLAQQNGWSTGVDGWFNPYCRTLAPVLNVCSWEPPKSLLLEAYGASEEKSVLANAAILPYAVLAKLTNTRAAAGNADIRAYRNVMERTHALIENGQVRFVFLHLPVPHPPGIYDRQRHMLRPGGTYLDNMVLADDSLGALLQEIDATPSASQTTVIVSSDHSWRIPLWRHAEFWSDEEERASGGRFDDRPVLLIHFPGQKSSNDINAALPELLEHDMIADMLRGRINNSEDLLAFLSQHGR
jgi:hypothetical protein